MLVARNGSYFTFAVSAVIHLTPRICTKIYGGHITLLLIQPEKLWSSLCDYDPFVLGAKHRRIEDTQTYILLSGRR